MRGISWLAAIPASFSRRTLHHGVSKYGHLYFLALRLRWYAIVCKSSSDVAIKIWSTAYSIVFTNFLLFSRIPFFITVLNSCIILLMYILNSTGERPHPCLTPLFMCIGSDIPSLNLILFNWIQFILCSSDRGGVLDPEDIEHVN